MTDIFHITYSPAALDDLRSIFSYIAYELLATQAATNQTKRIRKHIRSLDTMPGRYGKVEWEPWASMNMHKLPVDNYIVFYLIDEEKMMVTIVRIFYSGRDIESIIQSNND